MMMNEEILSEIKSILRNPFKNIEEADAKSWLEYCEKDLLNSYKEYLKAKERLKRAREKNV